jgi:hypothetical protein
LRQKKARGWARKIFGFSDEIKKARLPKQTGFLEKP